MRHTSGFGGPASPDHGIGVDQQVVLTLAVTQHRGVTGQEVVGTDRTIEVNRRAVHTESMGVLAHLALGSRQSRTYEELGRVKAVLKFFVSLLMVLVLLERLWSSWWTGGDELVTERCCRMYRLPQRRFADDDSFFDSSLLRLHCYWLLPA